MLQRLDLTSRDVGDARVRTTRDASARSIRFREKVERIEVLMDLRRTLPHIVHAAGDGFEVLVVTDSKRRARHFAYDLAGW